MTDNNPYSCMMCDRHYTGVAPFITHLKTSHPQISAIEYCIQFKIHDNYKCMYCGDVCRYISYNKGFKSTCDSKECINRFTQLKTKEAMLLKYGVESVFSIKEVRDKTLQTKLERYGDCDYNNLDKLKQTNLERYGYTSYTKTEEYRNKTKETNLRLYGVEHHTQCDEFKNKMKELNIERFGVDHPWKNADVLKTRENTVMERYGGYTLSSPELREKHLKTMVDKYGVEHAQQNLDIKEKTKQTNIDRYGVVCPAQNITMLFEKYGVERVCDIPGIIDLQKQNRKISLLEKYGVDNIMKLPDVIRKAAISISKSYKLKSYDTKFGDTIVYQSNPELDFIKDCELNDVRVLRGGIIEYEFEDKMHLYCVDFKVFMDNSWKLVEIKGKHPWYYDDLVSGKLQAKNDSAINYSIDNGYHDFEFKLVD